MKLQAIVKHIELWLIDKLIPFVRNPRTHSEAQIAQIAASVAEFGFNNPILFSSIPRSLSGVAKSQRKDAGMKHPLPLAHSRTRPSR